VVSDFLAGAAESLSPAADDAHWDVIEGQGALFHPSYAAVTLGLIHGSQPDVLVLCHEPGRDFIHGMKGFPTPSLPAAIEAYVATQNLSAAGLQLEFDGGTCTVTASGVAPDQATKEKILLCCGNVEGVAHVNDMMTVAEPADESQFHTVVRGDTLSAIAKHYYGNANLYPKIFEANKPMLSNPDKIYPGQLLRIPA